MAGLLTRPGHRAFPVLHQWQKFDVRFCGLTAAGSVPDFHRVPFSFGRRKPPETISFKFTTNEDGNYHTQYP